LSERTLVDRTLEVEIARFDPADDSAPRTVRYQVPREEGMVVADVLQYVYEHDAPDLGFLWECRTRRCGTCAVRLNDRPVLGCSEPVTNPMRLAPLAGLPVVRDLVVDRLALEARLAPWSGTDALPDDMRVLGRREEIEEYRGLSECIDCFVCDSVCPALKANAAGGPAFAGPRQLIRTEAQIQRRAEPLPWLRQATEGNLSLCTRCFACTEACPRDLRPMEAIGALTGRLYDRGDLDTHKSAHIGTFVRSVRHGGWLDEFRLLVDVYGPLGVLKFLPEALRMLRRGKLPKPHLGRSSQGTEIARMLETLGKGALPRPSIATKRHEARSPNAVARSVPAGPKERY
jgi:succinate dehydrogenase/fumarate reductase iron-sulfur protein